MCVKHPASNLREIEKPEECLLYLLAALRPATAPITARYATENARSALASASAVALVGTGAARNAAAGDGIPGRRSARRPSALQPAPLG